MVNPGFDNENASREWKRSRARVRLSSGKPRNQEGGRVMKEDSMEEGAVLRDGLGVVPTSFAIRGPKTVPRIDYERIFVLDEDMTTLGEHALRDDCPLEFADLYRSIPVNGMRHLVSFYQGEYAFTPFHVENLWFVVLTRGVPRIEERGSIGTLLAAMRVHLSSSLSPALATREATIRERDREMDARHAILARREQRVARLETDLQVAAAKMKELASEVRARESRLNALRDYALQMQRAFRQAASKPELPREAEERPAATASVTTPPRAVPSHDR